MQNYANSTSLLSARCSNKDFLQTLLKSQSFTINKPPLGANKQQRNSNSQINHNNDSYFKGIDKSQLRVSSAGGGFRGSKRSLIQPNKQFQSVHGLQIRNSKFVNNLSAQETCKQMKSEVFKSDRRVENDKLVAAFLNRNRISQIINQSQKFNKFVNISGHKVHYKSHKSQSLSSKSTCILNFVENIQQNNMDISKMSKLKNIASKNTLSNNEKYLNCSNEKYLNCSNEKYLNCSSKNEQNSMSLLKSENQSTSQNDDQLSGLMAQSIYQFKPQNQRSMLSQLLQSKKQKYNIRKFAKSQNLIQSQISNNININPAVAIHESEKTHQKKNILQQIMQPSIKTVAQIRIINSDQKNKDNLHIPIPLFLSSRSEYAGKSKSKQQIGCKQYQQIDCKQHVPCVQSITSNQSNQSYQQLNQNLNLNQHKNSIQKSIQSIFQKYPNSNSNRLNLENESENNYDTNNETPGYIKTSSYIQSQSKPSKAKMNSTSSRQGTPMMKQLYQSQAQMPIQIKGDSLVISQPNGQSFSQQKMQYPTGSMIKSELLSYLGAYKKRAQEASFSSKTISDQILSNMHLTQEIYQGSQTIKKINAKDDMAFKINQFKKYMTNIKQNKQKLYVQRYHFNPQQQENNNNNQEEGGGDVKQMQTTTLHKNKNNIAPNNTAKHDQFAPWEQEQEHLHSANSSFDIIHQNQINS